jgi:hypothetical protein
LIRERLTEPRPATDLDTLYDRLAEHVVELVATGVASERLRSDLEKIADQSAATMWSKLIERIERRKAASGDFRFNLRLVDGRLEDRNGRPILLTNRELEVVALLALGKRPYSTDEIIDAIWTDNPETGAASLKVVVARIRQKAGDPAIVQWARDGYAALTVRTANFNEMDEVFRAVRRGADGADWDDGEIERLLRCVRSLRDGFPANVARWPWFVSIDARYQRDLYDVALLCARAALEFWRFDVALRVAEELLDTDSGDEFAEEIASYARAALRTR